MSFYYNEDSNLSMSPNHYDTTIFYNCPKWDLLKKSTVLLGPFTPLVIKCIEPVDARHSAILPTDASSSRKPY